MTDFKVGQHVYCIDSEYPFGRCLNSTRKFPAFNKEFEIKAIRYDQYNANTLLDVIALGGRVPEERGRVFENIPASVFSPVYTGKCVRNMHVFYPDRLTYLATPYSTGGHENIDINYAKALQVTAGLIALGNTVFSPIVHGHVMAQKGMPLEGQLTAIQWKSYNEVILRRSEQLLVYCGYNWQNSMGVQMEIDYYIKIGRQNTMYKVDDDLNITPFGV